MAKSSQRPVAAPVVPAPPAPDTDFFQRPWLPPLLLVVAAVAVYGASLSNGFVFFDDDKAILYNPALQNPSLSKFFSGQNLGMYAPLSWMAYWVGSLISGQEAFGYHLLSLVFHALSAVLVFLSLQALTGRSWIAFFSALLFTVHPIQVEAVSWAAALSTALFACFYLAALYAYIRHAKGAGNAWLWASYGLFLASVLSKSAGVTLPLLLLAVDFLFFKEKAGKQWLQKAPYLIGALAFGYMTILTREAEGHDIEASSKVFSLADRFWMVSETLLFYPVKIWAPFSFSIAYPFEKINGVWPWYYYAAPAVLAAAAWLLWTKARSHRDVLWGVALYFLPLTVMLPFRTVGSFELRSDRYAYISCIGLFFLLGLLLEKTSPLIQKAATGVLALAFGALAFQQTQVWKDGIQLFKNCVDKTPQSALCQCNLAYNQLIRNDFQNSALHYSEALKLDPSTVEAYNGRGQAYLNLKKPQEALDDFSKAISAGLSSPKLFLNRGKCLVMTGKPVEAIPDLTQSITLEPKNPEAYYLRGFAHEKQEAMDKAIQDYGMAIQLNPNGIESYVNRGLLQYKKQDYEAAIADYSAAIRLNPNLAMAYNNRANAYIALGELQKASEDVEKALQISPDYQRALDTRKMLGGKK